MADKRRVGDRVMWPYGRKNYINCGEVGTVIEVRDEYDFDVRMDDEQPTMRLFDRKYAGGGRVQTFTTDHIIPLPDAYRETADRFRQLADYWDVMALAALPGIEN